jgi:putative spermidine/putrescine transport system permease protein
VSFVTDSWREPRRLLLATLGGLLVFYLLAPSLIVVPMSFSSSRALEFPPPGFSLEWYEQLLTDREWSRALVTSLEVAVLTSALATALGIAAAFGLVRGRFPGRNALFALVLSPLIVPVVVVAIAMFSVYVSGWGVGQIRFGGRLPGTLLGLVLAHTALALPYVVVNVASSLRGLDRNLEFAAMSLGASPWRTFRRVSLPLILPGVIAGALFAFVTSWDEVVVAIFMSSTAVRTLPVEMWQQVRTQVDPTVAVVSTLLLTVTTVVLFFAFVVRRGVRA